MATLTVVDTDADGLTIVGAAAAGGGDEFLNTGNELLLVTNGGGASRDVTLATPATLDGMAIASRVVAVPAGESRLIGPLKPNVYNDGDGMVQVTYSAVTSVTVKVFKFVK